MLEFLTPLGWLVAAAALLPILAAVVRARRDGRIRSRIALDPPGRRAQAATAIAASLALALLAAATARPSVRSAGTRPVRTDAQVFFVIDISRSMLAQLKHGPTRYARAAAAALRLRAAVPDVPAGLASITDRPLPHLFPTANRSLFSSVLRRAIGIQRPPSESGRNIYGTVTNFDPLAQLGTAGYFDRTLKHKLAILLTDGESDLFAPAALARNLSANRVALLVVRFWNPAERVYTARDRVEPYRPNRGALRPLQELASGTGMRIYAEDQLPDAVRAIRSRLGHGPTRAIGRPSRVELSPYVALAALLPIAFLLRRRDR
jgi:hypothetical protein